MTPGDFEDPTELARCALSDCNRYRVNDRSPLCAAHIREQETSSAGYVEPELEARLVNVQTEDDLHPGMVKVYDQETGEPSWVPAEEDVHQARSVQHVKVSGPDPDTLWPERLEDPLTPPPAPPQMAHTAKPATFGPAAHELDRNGTEVHLEASTPAAGCWVTFHRDWSGLALYADELEALRHAVANGMTVGWSPWGKPFGGTDYPTPKG